MNIECFTERKEGDGGICYFCEANLAEYLDSIPKEYNEYDIQRGFVNNVFLDTIVDTVKDNKFIPPIVLVLKNNTDLISQGQTISGDFNILDGLQRTTRLKMLYEATKFLDKHRESIIGLSGLKLGVYFKKNNDKEFLTESSYVKKAKEKELALNHFQEYTQWFEIWSNINKAQQIDKMILLNAGHKSMDVKHQLELIFLASLKIDKYNDDQCMSFCKDKSMNEEECKKYWEQNKCNKDFTCIIHSKETSTRNFYAKKRKYDIHFTLLLDAIIALEKQKPFAIDQKSLVDLQVNYNDYEVIKKMLSNENIQQLVNFFKSLDDMFCNEFHEKGLEFLGRESIIIGLFAAIGSSIEDYNDFGASILQIETKIRNDIQIFDVSSFENMKKQADSTAFTMGNLMKETVYYLTKSLLEGNTITFDRFPVNDSAKYRNFIKGLNRESE